jgi:hypothetical protein
MKKSYEQILIDLFNSKRYENVICLKLKGAAKPILTSVSEVRANRIITLNPVTLYGSTLNENTIHVEDIENCHVYSTRYSDPVYVRIRALKNSIDNIRKGLW